MLRSHSRTKHLPPHSPTAPLPASPRRNSCLTCRRPLRACICRWIAPITNEVEVLILQHPTEADQAKGSARLLHLSLLRSRVEVGETFSTTHLQELLYGLHGSPVHPVLLYPPMPGMTPPPAPDPGRSGEAGRLRLIVLDATWRKSMKMLYYNPLLQTLQRLQLVRTPPSAYLIRKARHIHQLSTLEATCHALTQLEQDESRYKPLLAAFDGFVAQQLSFRGSR
jgi:DTW domain-containing protein YfiP